MSDPITEAFNHINRANFLPEENKCKARLNKPIPIGYDQTNSQPSTVERMIRWLKPASGQKILDLGSGSGWTTALLSTIVGPTGTVYAVERIPQLLDFGKKNCENLELSNIRFYPVQKALGLVQFAPYDRILVSAEAPYIPDQLVNQLGKEGTMVIPVQNSIYIVSREPDGTIKSMEIPGFIFVPLIFDS